MYSVEKQTGWGRSNFYTFKMVNCHFECYYSTFDYDIRVAVACLLPLDLNNLLSDTCHFVTYFTFQKRFVLVNYDNVN